jgi:hypothetical protein
MNKTTLDQKSCEFNNLKRTRYFHGMLMTERDFREEQIYHNEKRRLLNRMLHGWGVVCGLKIKPTTPKSSKIIIETGLAIDCKGNEIFVCEKLELDVALMIKALCNVSKKKLTPEEKCAQMDEDPSVENKWYVVIKYKEVETDPVPVYTPGGGCEEKVCEYSRIKEGYCLKIISADDLNMECCPRPLQHTEGICDEHKESQYTNQEEIRQFLCETMLMPCPGMCCCKEQLVVLGSINGMERITSDTQIDDTMINNWDCRKYVITFGLLQHWMMKLAPKDVPLNAIVDYAILGGACQSFQSAVEIFKGICEDEEEDRGVRETTGLEISREQEINIPRIIKESAEDGITMTALSERLGVKAEIVKDVLDKLQKEGHIVKEKHRYYMKE